MNETGKLVYQYHKFIQVMFASATFFFNHRETLKIIIQRSSVPDDIEHRLTWSPHVPSPDEEEDEQEICNIVLTHGSDVSSPPPPQIGWKTTASFTHP